MIDPTTRRITHLVVEPRARHLLAPPGADRARARPPATSDEIALDCTLEDAAGLERAEEMAYLRLGEFPVDDARCDVTVTEMLALPYYQGIDMPSAGLYDYDAGRPGPLRPRPQGRGRGPALEPGDGPRTTTTSATSRGSSPTATQHVTHLVLEHGHLWGKRDVTIPIGAVARVEAGAVILSLTKDEVGRARAGSASTAGTRTPADRGPWARRLPRRRKFRRRGPCSSCSRSRPRSG